MKKCTKKTKKLWSLVLTVIMIVGMLVPTTVAAKTKASGTTKTYTYKFSADDLQAGKITSQTAYNVNADVETAEAMSFVINSNGSGTPVKVERNKNKTIGEESFTQWINLQGAGSESARSVSFTIPDNAVKTTVKVYAVSGNVKESRKMNLSAGGSVKSHGFTDADVWEVDTTATGACLVYGSDSLRLYGITVEVTVADKSQSSTDNTTTEPETTAPETTEPETTTESTGSTDTATETTKPDTTTEVTKPDTTTDSTESSAETTKNSVEITQSEGWLEEAYAEWNPVENATDYNVYVKSESGSYTQLDKELVRKYVSEDGSYYYRADAVGLSAGSYVLKIAPVISGEETTATETGALTVSAHDRTGFAWVNGTASGAYNEDGTLKSDAIVLYITEQTKDTVSLDVVTSSKGKTTNAVGLQNILNLYKKGYDSRPLDIRLIGQVTDLSVMEGGDIVISGSSSSKKLSCGITIEGIGDDATVYGWGIRIKNASNVEVRNLGIMLVDSDEGDNVGLQQDNDHIWVHNCDFFYGEAGGDSDQVKGDGALDCKKSTYITFSYNHFYDNGKCNLLGLSEGTTEDLYITYHHNWYDHSDSRHPRVRYYSAHVYNNYYDGNSKYGIGACLGASVFAEGNYFRNCKYPMLTSMQGHDVVSNWKTLKRDLTLATFSKENGGTIKAYNNKIIGGSGFTSYQECSTEFDAYVVSSADETVPSTVKSYAGGNTYNNFDTSSIMYSYTADDPDTAKANVEKYAGRVDGGDFSWTFTADDDESHTINAGLKAALTAYKTSFVSIAGADSNN